MIGKEFPKSKELTLAAKEVIGLFQKAEDATDNEQLRLLEEFYRKLQTAVVGEVLREIPGTLLKEIIFQRTNNLPMPHDTEGMRIKFWDYNPAEPDSMDQVPVGSPTRYMVYHTPGGKTGREFFDRFVKNFGGNAVDLRQELEKTD